MDTLGIKVADKVIPAKGIKAIRAEMKLSIADIKHRVAQRAYIFECDAVDEDGLALIIRLYTQLTNEDVVCELYEHDRISSITFFNNLANMYSEIGNEMDDIIDNEASDE